MAGCSLHIAAWNIACCILCWLYVLWHLSTTALKLGNVTVRVSVVLSVCLCVDKSHWDLVVKNSAYIDNLLVVLEVSCHCPVHFVDTCSLLNPLIIIIIIILYSLIFSYLACVCYWLLPIW